MSLLILRARYTGRGESASINALGPLAGRGVRVHALEQMFCVSEAEATAIRTAYEQKGELAAASRLPSFLNRTEHLTEYRLLCQHLRELFEQGP